MDRAYKVKHSANIGKINVAARTIKDYRSLAKLISAKQWIQFYAKGSFHKNLNIKHLTDILSERYKQTCQYQVVGALDSFVSNRQNDFISIIHRSSLANNMRQKMFIVNYHRLWHSNAPFTHLNSNLEVTTKDLKLARCIFRHVMGMHRKPNFKRINMALDSKVALISKKINGKAKSFDYWIRLSTVNKGKPIRIPLQSNDYFETIKGKTKNFCQVNLKNNNDISFSLIKDVQKPEYIPETPCVALDIGLVSLFATDKGDILGKTVYPLLKEYDALISSLASNRQRQGLPVRSPRYDRLVSNLREFLKNEINRVINRLIETYHPAKIVIERLDFRSPNLSRRMNRLLSLFGKAIITKKLTDIQEKFGITITETNPAYSSQECSVCGYVDKDNRLSQSVFKCKCCNSGIHADVNAGRNLRKRSSLPGIDIYKSKSAVLRILTGRFLSDAERIPRLYRKANDLLPVNPYFKDALAQSKGFL